MITHETFTRVDINKQNFIGRLSFICLLLFLLIGCVSPNPMSNEVRPGGTILAPIGASDGADMMNKSNVVAMIKDSNDTDHQATVRQIMRVFPDTTSDIGRGVPGDTNNLPQYYQSQWLAVIDFVDSAGVALPLSDGPAKLSLSESSVSIAMEMDVEILPGSPTTPNPLLSPQGPSSMPWLNYTSPNPQLAIRLDGVPAGRVAGASIKVRYVTSQFSTLMVTTMTNDSYLQMNAKNSVIDATDSEMHILLVNSNGFHDISGPLGSYRALPAGKSLERDLSSIVLFWPFGQVFDQATLDAAMSVEEANFYDADGNLLTDLNNNISLVYLGF